MLDLIASGGGHSICMLSAEFAEEPNMPVYQCFVFSRGRVSYWENIECDGRVPLVAALGDRLKNGKWNHAEAWSGGKLVCDLRRRRPSNEDASQLASTYSVLRFAE